MPGKKERFIARQPIFNPKIDVYAYELLFRSNLNNYFSHVDGDKASSRVIADSLLLFGVETMTGRAKAFINFTRSLLVNDFALVLPKEWTVVEVLENVEPDEEVVAACTRLKEAGFALALDDFVYKPEYESLLNLTSVVKVDFMDTDAVYQRDMAQAFGPRGITMLAEKVETRKEFELARELGYTLFQGYFFSQPIIVSRQDIPGGRVQLLQLLREINRSDIDLSELAKIIRSDVSISYKLLRYINSAAFGLVVEVKSIEQALNLLGPTEVRKWASLLALTGLSEDRPREIVYSSVIRAKLSELTAPLVGLGDRSTDMFLMGLFSMLDAIYGRPLDEILHELPLAPDVKNALLGRDSKTGQLLSAVIAQEQGDWDRLRRAANSLGLNEDKLPDLYQSAILYPEEVLGG